MPLLITNKKDQCSTSMLMISTDTSHASGFQLPEDMTVVVRYQKVLATEVMVIHCSGYPKNKKIISRTKFESIRMGCLGIYSEVDRSGLPPAIFWASLSS